jgi:integrase
MAISSLFAHAGLRNHAPKDFDPLEYIPRAKEADGEIEIYTPDELKSLLVAARTEMVSYLAIAAFGGLRQAELSRLDWNEVKDDHIVVLGGNTKTGRHRQVPILPNLAAWLRPHRQESGLVVPFKNVTNQLCKLVQQCEIQSKHNGLRHSFGSHRLAGIAPASLALLKTCRCPFPPAPAAFNVHRTLPIQWVQPGERPAQGEARLNFSRFSSP